MQKVLYNKPEFWFVSDFETNTSNTDYFDKHQDSIVILAHSVNWDRSKECTTTTIEDWLNYHLNLGVSQTIFFHNLSYDGIFIINYLDRIGIKPFSENNTRSSYYELFMNGNKIYYIRLNLRRKIDGRVKDYKIIFRCSLRILNSNVETLGKSLGLNKHHEDDDKITIDVNGRNRSFYDKEPLDSLERWESTSDGKRYLEYIKNDCEIVRRALIEFANSVNDLSFVKSKEKRKYKKQFERTKKFNPLDYLTTASLTTRLMELSIIQHIEKEKHKAYFPMVLKKEQYEFANKWFMGGFAQFNDEYSGNAQKVDKAIMLDVSSAYPYQMTYSLPYGEFLEEQPEGVENEDYYSFMEIRVKKAKIKDSHYCCPIMINWGKRNGTDKTSLRYVRELENFTCYYLSYEWETILKYYDVVVESVSIWYIKARKYLKSYAQELYDLKNHYSKTKQDGLKQAMKILINAGYGCLAKRLKYDTNILLSEEDAKFFKNMERDELFTFNERTFKFHFIKDFNFNGTIKRIACETDKEKSEGANKAAAAVITSRERVYLWELIEKVGVKHFGYSDTDSILFINLSDKQFNDLKDFANPKIVKLGDWEQELVNKKITYFGSYGAKKYQIFDEEHELIKFRFAGVSDKLINPKNLLQEIDFNDDTVTIKNATLVKKHTPSGLVLVPNDKIMSKGKI